MKKKVKSNAKIIKDIRNKVFNIKKNKIKIKEIF